MFRPAAAFAFSGLALCAAFLGVAFLAACTGNGPPSGQPSFYIDLSKPGTTLDANAAQSMISGYRGNNGLGPLVIDPELMRLASDQAQAMAARDKLDHDAAHPFAERIRKSGYNASVAVENIGAGYHTLAEAFSGWRDSPPHQRQYAQFRRHPDGHRRGLYAEVEIQSVLVADHGHARGSQGLIGPNPAVPLSKTFSPSGITAQSGRPRVKIAIVG